ncbi:tryptophan 2,3-dioxygenase [Tropicimonas marinistellae]|uniref:tryptophan 2,3-dioxygenase n=1 Tax=Tropicimonas marinistellae TaxID=1739787 RepID=UPI00083346CB|nr:tryptophan 2,3-dioxygenase family protein [Tropicimonas marinistellae]
MQNDDLSYGSHLMLDRLLSAQRPISGRHDEMLFIIQHQTSELWLKLIIEELGVARKQLLLGHLRPALKALDRTTVVLELLVKSWDVLRTLTPVDFTSFRNALGSASGFQSHQYRMIEFMLGNRAVSQLEAHASNADALQALRDELGRPSVYQAALSLLDARSGAGLHTALIPQAQPYRSEPAVLRAWQAVYSDPDGQPDLFDLAEAFVALEDALRCWRFNHVTTVERVIGAKSGTGGTTGVSYLRRLLDVELFPELWQARTAM